MVLEHLLKELEELVNISIWGAIVPHSVPKDSTEVFYGCLVKGSGWPVPAHANGSQPTLHLNHLPITVMFLDTGVDEGCLQAYLRESP